MSKVFVNGTFDILHIGHIELLNWAKSHGDYLLVAIDSDERVSQLKGCDRPVIDQNTRYHIMKNLKSVDEVAIFSSDEGLTNLIREYQPDIMIVGSDWEGRKVIGSEYAKELKFYERISTHSTTQILENYVNRRHVP